MLNVFPDFMPDEIAIDRLKQEFSQLLRRVERLEGRLEQLRVQTIHPSLLFPSRRDFDELKERVGRLETPKPKRKR